MERPKTQFAWNGDVSLAYQLFGNGPSDLVYLQGYGSNVDMNWESPYLARFLRALAGHARLIITDRRGWGCSERFTPGYVPDVDVLSDDILAVMEAAGSERASVLATYESAIVALLFAATYPDRTRSLVLVDPMVTYLPTDETPWMPSLERWQEQIRAVRETWGTIDWWDSPAGPEREWFSRYARASITPGGLAAELSSYLHTDIRAILPTIQVPTLVLVDSERSYEVPPEAGRFVASKIAGARLIEHSSRGGPHFFHWYARGDAIVAEVGRFLAEIGEEEASFNRILATVLFTDIVASTERAARREPGSRVGDVADCGEILVAAARDVADELLTARDADPYLERSSRRVAVAHGSHERARRFDCLLSVMRAGEPRHEGRLCVEIKAAKQ